MSVLIKGMEMPTSCYGCCFFHQTDYWNKDGEADVLSCCKRTGERTFDDFIKYLPNCPLVPVPPHGRLIDADAMEYEEAYLNGHYEFGDVELVTREDIESAPTIIPAEEGE